MTIIGLNPNDILILTKLNMTPDVVINTSSLIATFETSSITNCLMMNLVPLALTHSSTKFDS